ncbi:hypothetical protein [Mesorhizobium sp. Cs1321R2N1]|uniref:hypothetical protein n=1 Tax=Mesorhizobium sp. Cs1321R2N1 TaxID=3015174 RepID=UPI00301D09E5
MVSKRRNALYHSGKSDSWIKVKCWDVADFELLGIKSEAGKMTEGLLAKDGKYVGKTAVSANRSIKERLWRRVEQARSGQPPGIPNAVADDFEWLRPGMTARVRYLRGESKLRHALVQDVREKDDAGGSIEGPRDGRGLPGTRLR